MKSNYRGFHVFHFIIKKSLLGNARSCVQKVLLNICSSVNFCLNGFYLKDDLDGFKYNKIKYYIILYNKTLNAQSNKKKKKYMINIKWKSSLHLKFYQSLKNLSRFDGV